MKIGKKFLLEKLPFLGDQKKYQKDFLFKIWFFFKNNIGIKENIFPKILFYFFIFCPLDFFENMDPKRGSSHWFLNQNQKYLGSSPYCTLGNH